MTLDNSAIPTATEPAAAILSILWYIFCVAWAALILILIAYRVHYMGKANVTKFEICAFGSVFCSFVFGMWSMLCMNNFIIAYDYLGTDATFVTNADSVVILIWVISKLVFYVSFQMHIESYFDTYLQSWARKALRFGLGFVIVFVLAGCISAIVIDAQSVTESELLRINSHLVLIEAVNIDSVMSSVAPVIVAIGDLTYFVCLTIVYRSVYSDNGIGNDNANDNASAISKKKDNAKYGHFWMCASTFFTVLQMIMFMTAWDGRTLFGAVGTMVDDFAMLYLVYSSGSAMFMVSNAYQAVVQDPEQEESEALL